MAPVPEATAAIEVRDLRKEYGSVEAVRGVSFDVRRGEVFGLLGPNGAGKTTTVEILEGYRQRSGGEARVLGLDPGTGDRRLREQTGIVLQSSGLWRHIRVREALEHWARMARAPRPVDEVLELVGLTEKAERLARTLSGGQMRRLDFALALVGDPELVFLDEPTTGFDPQARRDAWDVVRSLKRLGKTVLLTTHYLDEAQELCDRVAIVQGGRIIAIGAPDELTPSSGRHVVRWRTASMAEEEPARSEEVDDPTALLHRLTEAALADDSQRLTAITVLRPSLEDVYLELTGEESAS